MEDKNGKWVTMPNGAHVFIKKGQSIDDAFDTTRLSSDKSDTPEKRFEEYENKRLVHLSADDYYRIVAHELGTTPEKLRENREATSGSELTIDEIAERMKKGEKFGTPWITLSDYRGINPYFQEGLHRIAGAEKVYGKNVKFPVWLASGSEIWDDIEDDMDLFLLNLDSVREENELLRDKQNLMKEQQKVKDVAKWFGISEDKVTKEHIKRYYEELDDLFSDDF